MIFLLMEENIDLINMGYYCYFLIDGLNFIAVKYLEHVRNLRIGLQAPLFRLYFGYIIGVVPNQGIDCFWHNDQDSNVPLI